MKRLIHKKFKLGKDGETELSLQNSMQGNIHLYRWKAGTESVLVTNFTHREVVKLRDWLSKVIDFVERNEEPEIKWPQGYWNVKCPCAVCMCNLRKPTCIHVLDFLDREGLSK